MNRMIFAVALGGLVSTAAVQAQSPINARQINQERRIDAGTRSGKLTAREAARLKAQQRSIAYEEKRMRARHGGHLTAHDKAILHARQEQANRSILAQKHDAQRGRNKLKL